MIKQQQQQRSQSRSRSPAILAKAEASAGPDAMDTEPTPALPSNAPAKAMADPQGTDPTRADPKGTDPAPKSSRTLINTETGKVTYPEEKKEEDDASDAEHQRNDTISSSIIVGEIAHMRTDPETGMRTGTISSMPTVAVFVAAKDRKSKKS